MNSQVSPSGFSGLDPDGLVCFPPDIVVPEFAGVRPTASEGQVTSYTVLTPDREQLGFAELFCRVSVSRIKAS